MLTFTVEAQPGPDIRFPAQKDERMVIFMILLKYMYCCLQLQYFTGGI